MSGVSWVVEPSKIIEYPNPNEEKEAVILHSMGEYRTPELTTIHIRVPQNKVTP